jgi:hypothetical protein
MLRSLFWRFSPIFCDKITVFRKKSDDDCFRRKNLYFESQSAVFFSDIFSGENIFAIITLTPLMNEEKDQFTAHSMSSIGPEKNSKGFKFKDSTLP